MNNTKELSRESIFEQIRDYVHQSQSESFDRSWPLALNTLGADEIIAAVDVLLSGQITMGKCVAEFEKAWSACLGVEHSVMVNSGSSANLLAMSAFASEGLRPGDEVIVPAVTWPTTVFPIAQVGAVPVLVDVDLETLTLTPDIIRQALSPKTRAIVPVHLLGNPCDMPEIQNIARQHSLWVMEDCCEAHGAQIGDRAVGTFGELSTFSYYFSHHMTTIEGGMISILEGAKRDNFLRSARSHGWARDRSDRDALADLFADRDDRWLFVAPGYNLRPMELTAAIGLVQLGKLPDFVARRAEVRRALLDGLADCADVLQFQRERPGCFHSAFGFSMIVREGAPFTRDALRDHLESKNIETRPAIGGNLARQPALKHITWRAHGELTNAECIDRQGLMIGINPGVRAAQIQYVIDTISEFVKQTAKRQAKCKVPG